LRRSAIPGRAIRIFLVDGSAAGLKTAEIGLSTIKGVYAPRGALDALARRDESRKTGIYVLVGQDPEFPGRAKIYIGEGDDVLSRIVLHDRDPNRDFWESVAIFVSKDQNLTKAHVRYLEARLIDLATRARRCTIDNRTAPLGGPLPEADAAEMEEFLEHLGILLATLGINAFEPAPTPSIHAAVPSQEQPEFRLTGDGYSATSLLVDGEFVVQKGSVARFTEAPSLSISSRTTRAELIATGVLARSERGYEFSQPFSFPSASGSAQVIVGANINGRVAWKRPDGTSFAEWQDGQLGGPP
jgi:hypothetical protein